MASCIYTNDELITKIKEIDLKLDKAIESSSLDTNQGKQSFSRQISLLTKQRDRYTRMCQQFYPSDFNNIIALGTNRRGY